MSEAERMRDATVKVVHRRVNGFHHENCDRGHYESDTGAFVCSNRAGCLCDERTEEAEAIEAAIRALPIPAPQPDPREEEIVEAIARGMEPRAWLELDGVLSDTPSLRNDRRISLKHARAARAVASQHFAPTHDPRRSVEDIKAAKAQIIKPPTHPRQSVEWRQGYYAALEWVLSAKEPAT